MSLNLTDNEFIGCINHEYSKSSKELLQGMVVVCVNNNCIGAAKYLVSLLDDGKVNVYKDLEHFHTLLQKLLLLPSNKDVVYNAIVKGINVTAKELFLTYPEIEQQLIKLLGKHYNESDFGLPRENAKLSGMVMNIMNKILTK